MELKNRLKDAVVMLKEGVSFKVGNVFMGVKNKELYLSINSNLSSLDNIDKNKILNEIKSLKAEFIYFNEVSHEFKLLSESKIVVFSIDYNYGMGTIRICSEVNGNLEWTYKS